MTPAAPPAGRRCLWVGRAAPSSSPAAAAASACPERLCGLCRQSVRAPRVSHRHGSHFAGNAELCRAQHSTREGVQLPLFLHQPSQRAPPPVRNMPRYPTGRHGGDLCSFLSSSLGSGSAAAPVQPTQPAPRLRSPGPRTSWQPGRERCRESSAKPSL